MPVTGSDVRAQLYYIIFFKFYVRAELVNAEPVAPKSSLTTTVSLLTMLTRLGAAFALLSHFCLPSDSPAIHQCKS